MSFGVRRAGIVALTLGWLLAIHMVLLGSSRPVVRTARIAVAGWPAGAAPIRIALLSDFHVSAPSDPPARLTAIVADVDRLRPDLVLLAGDFLSTASLTARDYPPAAAVAPLAGLRAPLGVYAVPGNHDYGQIAALRRALAGIGIPLLVNRTLRFGPIALLGIDDSSNGHPDLPAVLAQARRTGGIPVALTHDPAALLKLPTGVPVALAGHTHCGQISPPPIGPIVTSSRAGLRYVCGVVRDPGRITIVTGGLGTSDVPFRLGAAPDWWMVEIGGPR